MALTLTHTFVSTHLESGSSIGLISANEWNASHTVAGTLDSSLGGTGTATLGSSGNLFFNNSTAIAAISKSFYNSSNQLTFDPGMTLDWVPSSDVTAAPDTFIGRQAAATVRLGSSDAPAPVSQTLQVQSVSSGTANTQGADWTFVGSKGTGNASGGGFFWKVGTPGAAGSDANALLQVLRLTSSGVLILGTGGQNSHGQLELASNDGNLFPQLLFNSIPTSGFFALGPKSSTENTLRLGQVVSLGATWDPTVANTANFEIFNGWLGFGTATNGDVSLSRSSAKVLQFGDGTVNTRGWMQWQGQQRVTSDFSVSNSTTATAITGISSVPVGQTAVRNYKFEAWLATAGSTNGGISIAITCTSSTIAALSVDGFILDNNVVRGQQGVITSTTTPVVNSSAITSSAPTVRLQGLIRGVSSGTFGLSLAQSTANATAVVVSSGSWLEMTDVP